MATCIRKAGCSALKLAYPDYASLVHFPADAEYRLEHPNTVLHNETFSNILVKITYLFKLRSKVQGEHNYGGSCLIGNFNT
ncbi:TPA: inovirus-type Gp2 protein [Aeromonas hydrophila]|nr:inovirus-type Gp2 protein [Aeromonas hydrophila]